MRSNSQSNEVTQEDIDAFMGSLEAQGTPWADGCAALIGTLWNGYTPLSEILPKEPTAAIVNAMFNTGVKLSMDDVNALYSAIKKAAPQVPEVREAPGNKPIASSPAAVAPSAPCVVVPIYIASAYRWGWYNAHNYLIYVGTDKAKAIALAQAECDGRGGKYGCVVCDYTEDDEGEMQSRQVAYFPSIYGEKALHHNYRIDYFEKLGHVLDNAADGSVHLAEPGTSVLKLTKVEPPAWLLAERDRAKEFYDAMTKGAEERRGERNGTGK